MSCCCCRCQKDVVLKTTLPFRDLQSLFFRTLQGYKRDFSVREDFEEAFYTVMEKHFSECSIMTMKEINTCKFSYAVIHDFINLLCKD